MLVCYQKSICNAHQEEINEKRESSTPIHTKRANVKAGRAFRAFLMETRRWDRTCGF
jgi:hypothetical protein